MQFFTPDPTTFTNDAKTKYGHFVHDTVVLKSIMQYIYIHICTYVQAYPHEDCNAVILNK